MDLMNNNLLFIILESGNPDFVLSILDQDSSTVSSISKIDVTTTSGNIMFVLNDSYYNGHLDFFAESKEL